MRGDAAGGRTSARSRHKDLLSYGWDDERELGPFLAGVEHLGDDARIRAADPETADSASHVPVDRSSKRVLEVIPEETSTGAKQVAQRDVPMQGLVRKT